VATENTTEFEKAGGGYGNGVGRGFGGVCFLGLGANLGDRLSTLRVAVATIDAHEKIDVDFDGGIASLYETTPVGCGADQPNYINSVIRVATTLSPRELLTVAREIEERLGRERKVRWESRIIDIDLLLYVERGAKRAVDPSGRPDRPTGSGRVVTVATDDLTLPHPRICERRFVLDPLAEVSGDVVHPIAQCTISELAERASKDCAGQSITRIAGPAWVRGDFEGRESAGAAT
jgi:2-amino-4-hydroxy-6-hydroxymethyldihydropteridine diphosphokinase